MLPPIVKVKESDRWWIRFLRRKVIYEPYDSSYTPICTGNNVGVWDSSRAQIRVDDSSIRSLSNGIRNASGVVHVDGRYNVSK